MRAALVTAYDRPPKVVPGPSQSTVDVAVAPAQPGPKAQHEPTKATV
jgi:hypothetical protein